MEPGEMLANYLGKQRWEQLKARRFAGKRNGLAPDSPAYFDSRDTSGNPARTAPIPARPVWLDDDDIVYRHLLLKNFKGVLTYGSPLEKFAAIWPARVPINKTEPHFHPESEWINVYDPVDPVSGVLRAFTLEGMRDHCVPRLINIGFATHPALLYAHLRYLSLADRDAKDLGDAIAHWVLEDRPFRVPTPPRDRWFVPYEGQHRRRWWLTAFEWIAVYLLIGWIGSYFVPQAAKLIPKAIKAYVLVPAGRLEAVFQGAASYIPDTVRDGWMWLNPVVRDFLAHTFGFIGACALITLAVGIFAGRFFFKRDPDDTRNEVAQGPSGKSRFVAEGADFGLIGAPIGTTAGLWARSISKIKGLVGW
jgi:hypothetical protein